MSLWRGRAYPVENTQARRAGLALDQRDTPSFSTEGKKGRVGMAWCMSRILSRRLSVPSSSSASVRKGTAGQEGTV